MKTVVVSGALANKPLNGGEAWVRLSWVKGLRRLGLDVYFVEQIAPQTCVRAGGKAAAFAASVNLEYFRSVVKWAGIRDRAALACGEGEACEGIGWPRLLDLASSADLLVNISGHLRIPAIFERFRRTAYIDIDPGFTQFWHADGTAPLPRHDFYFTIGENIGSAECAIPAGGLGWRPVRQPVVLEDWPVPPAPPTMRFTTVASWRGPFGRVTFGGRTYGLKLHEFRKVIDLPRRVPHTFELALDIHPAEVNDLALLRDNGWRLTDPMVAAATPESFRQYVQNSSAEFSPAQGVYVETNSGWFSDRTVRYLASGRPALVQETGFSRNIETGVGLVPFLTPDEAAEGAERIVKDYAAHCRAARAVAERYFGSDRVLSEMLRQIESRDVT